MDPISSLAQAYDLAHGVIANVPADRWNTQSPCSEWDTRGVVNHIIGGAKMVTACVSGHELDMSTLAGDLAGDNPAANFRSAADAALAAFRADPAILAKTVKMPFGEFPGAAVAGIFINDNFAHAWDIAKASGQNTDIAPEMAEAVLTAAQGFITPELRMPGLFDAEKPAPANASAADRVAAFMGRTV